MDIIANVHLRNLIYEETIHGLVDEILDANKGSEVGLNVHS